MHDGVRESEQSWHEVLLDLKVRGLEISPGLAVGDGSLGFWKAIRKAWPKTRSQRCWTHKTVNVLNYLRKRAQPEASVARRAACSKGRQPSVPSMIDQTR